MTGAAKERFSQWVKGHQFSDEIGAEETLWETYLSLGGKDIRNHEKITHALDAVIDLMRYELMVDEFV